MMQTKLVEKYKLGPQERKQRKQFLGLTAEDEKAIGGLAEEFGSFASQLAEGFYRHLLSHAHTAAFLQDSELLERLKQLQMDYFCELVSGQYDERYFEKRLRVGETHDRVGLAPTWYLGAFSQYLQLALPFFAEKTGGKTTREIMALLKLILLDIGLSLETYFSKAAERLRQRNEELEQALQMYWQAELRAKQYAKLAGHEIRGSLNAIAAACDTAAEELDESPQVVRDMLESAQRRCIKTAGVVESILAEPERAGEPTWVDVSDLLDEVAGRVDLYASDRKVDLALPTERVRVWADPVGLREVFANLVSNAIQHLDKDPGRVSIEYRQDDQEHVFCVSDNGPGIAEELHEQIFQPFFRGPEESQRDGKGLGLHFVSAIVAQHGGRVWLESERGVGSRFYFSMPCAPAYQPVKPAAGAQMHG